MLTGHLRNNAKHSPKQRSNYIFYRNACTRHGFRTPVDCFRQLKGVYIVRHSPFGLLNGGAEASLINAEESAPISFCNETEGRHLYGLRTTSATVKDPTTT